jgi:hypothetical protein
MSEVKKGGQKAPASVADRIDTPDAVNVEAVMDAVAKVEREKAELAARKVWHMPDCGIHRGGELAECGCPANLVSLPPPLELEEVSGGGVTVNFIRVDEGFTKKVTIPDPQNSARTMVRDMYVAPKWICTSCGAAVRCLKVGGHLCDPAFLVFKARPVPISLGLPSDKRFAGGYRLSVWRDLEGTYHLSELVLDAGRVVHDGLLVSDNDYNTFEGSFSDMLIREFSP